VGSHVERPRAAKRRWSHFRHLRGRGLAARQHAGRARAIRLRRGARGAGARRVRRGSRARGGRGRGRGRGRRGGRGGRPGPGGSDAGGRGRRGGRAAGAVPNRIKSNRNRRDAGGRGRRGGRAAAAVAGGDDAAPGRLWAQRHARDRPRLLCRRVLRSLLSLTPHRPAPRPPEPNRIKSNRNRRDAAARPAAESVEHLRPKTRAAAPHAPVGRCAQSSPRAPAAADALERFLRTYGLSHLVRAHEVRKTGFQVWRPPW
jgi:hypothetical protein